MYLPFGREEKRGNCQDHNGSQRTCQNNAKDPSAKTEMEKTENPRSDKTAQNPNDDISDQAKTCSPEDLTPEPSGYRADKKCDKYVHMPNLNESPGSRIRFILSAQFQDQARSDHLRDQDRILQTIIWDFTPNPCQEIDVHH